jgi:hypothetical protein
MSIEWSCRVSRVPSVAEVARTSKAMLDMVGASTAVFFRQQLKEGQPIESPIFAEESWAVDGLWARADHDALASIDCTCVPELPTDEETGTWCHATAGRSPGSMLFAAILATAIASTVRADFILDEVARMGLGRRYTVAQFTDTLKAAPRQGLVEAEAMLLRR